MPMVKQPNGNFARIFDYGKNIGIDRATGQPTARPDTKHVPSNSHVRRGGRESSREHSVPRPVPRPVRPAVDVARRLGYSNMDRHGCNTVSG